MRRSVYRPQNPAFLSCAQAICDDLNRSLHRSSSRSCHFDGFSGKDSGILSLPGTCSLCSRSIQIISEVMKRHDVSFWDWELYDNGVQVQFERRKRFSAWHLLGLAFVLYGMQCYVSSLN